MLQTGPSILCGKTGIKVSCSPTGRRGSDIPMCINYYHTAREWKQNARNARNARATTKNFNWINKYIRLAGSDSDVSETSQPLELTSWPTRQSLLRVHCVVWPAASGGHSHCHWLRTPILFDTRQSKPKCVYVLHTHEYAIMQWVCGVAVFLHHQIDTNTYIVVFSPMFCRKNCNLQSQYFDRALIRSMIGSFKLIYLWNLFPHNGSNGSNEPFSAKYRNTWANLHRVVDYFTIAFRWKRAHHSNDIILIYIRCSVMIRSEHILSNECVASGSQQSSKMKIKSFSAWNGTGVTPRNFVNFWWTDNGGPSAFRQWCDDNPFY